MPFCHVFQLMNLEDSQQECHGSLIGNSAEAKFVAGLAKHVKRELERHGEGHKSLGILTFYNRQRRLILEELKKMRVAVIDERQQQHPDENAISVRSVDGFQVRFTYLILYSFL